MMDWELRLERAKHRLRQDASPSGDRPDSLEHADWGDASESRDVASLLEAEGFSEVTLIGRGGSGIVFRADMPSISEPVAVKVLTGTRWSLAARGRFLRESSLAASIRHPHLVRLLHTGLLDQQWPYLVMEWIDGHPLSACLHRGGRLPPDRAVHIVRDVARGLAELHHRGWIHRDIKPANILLRRDSGEAVLADFGLSRPAEPGHTVTSSDTLPGTPQYMAPEHFRPDSEVSATADVYSLGVVLFELLSGEPPFRGNLPQLIAQTLYGRPPCEKLALAGVSEPLVTIIRRALARRPADRYGTAEAMKEDLEAWLAGRSLPSSRTKPPIHRRLRPLTIPLTCVLALACLSWTPVASRRLRPAFLAQGSPPATTNVDAAPQAAVTLPVSDALSWVLYRRQAEDPRPTARREMAVRAMLGLVRSMGNQLDQLGPDRAAAEAGLALSQGELYRQLTMPHLMVRIRLTGSPTLPQPTIPARVEKDARHLVACGQQARTFYEPLAKRIVPFDPNDPPAVSLPTGLDPSELLLLTERACGLVAEGHLVLHEDEQAVRAARTSLSWARHARRVDPHSPSLQLVEARASLRLALALLMCGNLPSARKHVQSASAILSSLPKVARDLHPAHAGEVAEVLAMEARAWMALRRPALAVKTWRRWQEQSGDTPSGDVDPSLAFETTQAWLEWGEACWNTGQIDEARTLWQKAQRQLEQLIEQDGDFEIYRRLLEESKTRLSMDEGSG